MSRGSWRITAAKERLTSPSFLSQKARSRAEGGTSRFEVSTPGMNLRYIAAEAASCASALRIDRLRIVSADPALDRGTGIALGKNFGRRFYVEIITDGRGYSATEVEFRITSWLALLASVSTIGRESVVAEISRDY